MRRRGFLASLIGLVALRKMPAPEVQPNPVVIPQAGDPFYEPLDMSIWNGSTGTCSTVVLDSTGVYRIDGLAVPWSYTANSGITGVTLTLG